MTPLNLSLLQISTNEVTRENRSALLRTFAIPCGQGGF